MDDVYFDSRGPLFFPVTPYTTHGDIAYNVLADHVSDGVSAGAGAVFIAGGTGEFHSLSTDEYTRVVSTAVDATAGRVRVFAGVGGSIATAVQWAEIACTAGAHGLLQMPPYLAQGPQEGLIQYTKTIAGTTDLPIVFYHRNGAILTPQTASRIASIPNVIGLKDGHGDLELLQDIMISTRTSSGVDGRNQFLYLNGLPTAEASMRAYRGVGVSSYSSSTFAFAPEIAMAFYRAMQDGDDTMCESLLVEFYMPLARLRRRLPGYAVSLIKAGMRLRGLSVGGVRPPLLDPTRVEFDELERLLDVGASLATRSYGELRTPDILS